MLFFNKNMLFFENLLLTYSVKCGKMISKIKSEEGEIMFNSLLSVSVDTLIMDIFIILGVVIAASLIVYFIWEAILSYTSKKNKSENQTVSTKVNDTSMENFFFDKQQPAEEPKLLENANVVDVDEVKAAEEEKDANSAQVEETEEERLNRERREYLERRRQELIKRLQEEQEEPETEEEQEEVTEETSEEADEVEEEEPETEEEIAEDYDEAVTTNPEVQAQSEEIEKLEAEKAELLKEKERYEQMVRELEDAKQKLLETVQPEVVTAPIYTYTLDELKLKLADAEEKLKANEKEFKQCKKDFIPLNKVWRTHEKDEKKLRRKEALVAKQKVVLYGVNNYADIDEEKAKKLAEDLDLLDGLKLSVQHCEEVMAKNAERYPLLKRMYEVLKTQNTELKDEVKSLREEIAKLEEQENVENSESTENE